MIVSDFLIDRMENSGIEHVFGVPGDYVLNFYKKLSNSEKINLINTTDENHAGFAADAYSRIKGIGCVCVTYNVGAAKLINAVQCAYAERSPLVVISGSPGMKERDEGVLLHHMVRSFECQKEVFENFTCDSVVLDDPNTAGYKIDKAFEALHYYKQPIYIELPRDVADKPIGYDVYKQGTPNSPVTDLQNLDESFEEVETWINNAKNPVILAGIEVSRFGLGSKLVKFAEKANIPIATTLLSKSVIGETHPLYLGVYAGSTSQEGVQEAVEGSDCLLMFGAMLTDMTLSFMPSKFEKRNTVSCSIQGLKVKNHMYASVNFEDFCNKLFDEASISSHSNKPSVVNTRSNKSFSPLADAPITSKRLFEKIDSMLTKDMTVVADIGDSLFGAADLTMHHKNAFLGSAFYTSMGTSIPGALGAGFANPKSRVVVIVGDGAFQMSCTELSTIVANKLNPIIFILNNHGYTTERFLLDGDFNDIPDWNYHKFVDIIGGGKGAIVKNESELEEVVSEALASKEMFLINVSVDSYDVSSALERMTSGLAKKV